MSDSHLSPMPLPARRRFLAGLSALFVGGCLAQGNVQRRELLKRLSEIQSRIGGALGVHVLDTETGSRIQFNDQSRFAMASTFKWLLAAAVLSRVDANEISLEQRVPFGPEDLLAYAPVASARLAEGSLSVGELCAAAVAVSDNTAANLLLPLIGGPDGLTRFLRGTGDPLTRLDRIEPELNSNLQGDLRDTTTPRAMVQNIERLLVGDSLSTSSRKQLIDWLVSSRTGLKRIRAGLPADWIVGDKTGTGMNGAVNDIAIAWPPGRKPILIAVYMSGSTLPASQLDGVHAEIARLASREFL